MDRCFAAAILSVLLCHPSTAASGSCSTPESCAAATDDAGLLVPEPFLGREGACTPCRRRPPAQSPQTQQPSVLSLSLRSLGHYHCSNTPALPNEAAARPAVGPIVLDNAVWPAGPKHEQQKEEAAEAAEWAVATKDFKPRRTSGPLSELGFNVGRRIRLISEKPEGARKGWWPVVNRHRIPLLRVLCCSARLCPDAP